MDSCLRGNDISQLEFYVLSVASCQLASLREWLKKTV